MTEFELARTECEVPEPDQLVVGAVTPDLVKLALPGDYKRGMLLMSSDFITYEPATLSGAKTAESLCILAEDCNLPTDNVAYVTGYFDGIFNASKVIFAFEGENDSHDEIVEELRGVIREEGIYLR